MMTKTNDAKALHEQEFSRLGVPQNCYNLKVESNPYLAPIHEYCEGKWYYSDNHHGDKGGPMVGAIVCQAKRSKIAGGPFRAYSYLLTEMVRSGRKIGNCLVNEIAEHDKGRFTIYGKDEIFVSIPDFVITDRDSNYLNQPEYAWKMDMFLRSLQNFVNEGRCLLAMCNAPLDYIEKQYSKEIRELLEMRCEVFAV